MAQRVYSPAECEAILLMLPAKHRAHVVDRLLKSLKGSEADEGWIEELEWRLQDWRARLKLEPLDDLLDVPTERLDELVGLASKTAS